MKILIKQAHVIAPDQPFDGKIKDILLEQGVIQAISDHLDTKANLIIEEEGLCVSPGWMDVFAHFCDPGTEFKETLKSGANAAAAGGYTDVMVIPNTQPCLDNRSQVENIVQHSRDFAVSIHPIGAISNQIGGKSLAEMYDMFRAGALAFSDGEHPIQSTGLMLKALEYVKAFNGTLIQIPEEPTLAQFGLMHEGEWSVKLGVNGIPDLAEKILLKRDLDLLAYTDSKIHFTGLSLDSSIQTIKEAKENGLSVSCSVTPYHLLLTDEKLSEFDSHFKVTPPLRTQKDVDSLKTALREGTIDCLASHHFPQDWDSKNKEFEYASPGMIGLESAFGLLGLALPDWEISKKIELLAYRPREIFGLPVPQVTEGEQATLSLFLPETAWTYRTNEGLSKSKNTPFEGKVLNGKPLGIINNGKLFIDKKATEIV